MISTKQNNLEEASSAATTQLPKKIKPGEYIETEVHGSRETGVTIVNESGRGTFFPDDETKISSQTTKSKVFISFPYNKNEKAITLDALYPQWKETETETVKAISLVKKSFTELQNVVENPCISPAEVLNVLLIAETLLFQALENSKFNKAFELVVSFCAWALKNIELKENSPSFQGMCVALREIQEKPFIKLDRATRIIIELEKHGWSDESELSIAFNSGLNKLTNVR
jgi:hypothetical protein